MFFKKMLHIYLAYWFVVPDLLQTYFLYKDFPILQIDNAVNEYIFNSKC